jgi:uncharacterized protein YukJ
MLAAGYDFLGDWLEASTTGFHDIHMNQSGNPYDNQPEPRVSYNNVNE